MDYLSFILHLVLAVVAIHLLRSIATKRRNESSSKKLPPGPRRLPIVGNLFNLDTKPHVNMSELAKTYGPLMSLKLGQLQTIIISSPDIAKEILHTNDLSFCYRPALEAVCVANHIDESMGMLPLGPKFRILRKISNTHIFATGKLDATQSIRRDKMKDFISYVEKRCQVGQSVEIVQAAFTMILNLLSSTFFSMDLGDPSSDIAHEMRESIRGIMEEAGTPNLADFFPILKRFDPQGIKRRSSIHWSKMIDLLNNLIDQRSRGKGLSGSTEDHTDVLDALLNEELNKETGSSYIPHLLVDLIVGGTDTTSSTIEWAMTELLRNPEKLWKAQAEVHKIVGKENTVEESDIERLAYLQAIIKETFRLHPPVPLLLPRKAVKDVDMLGFTIPKDAQLLINVWAIGKDPNIWDNPESFQPERFLSSNIDVKGHHFELIPFGSGRRSCPGMALATKLLHLMLASLIHGFDWKLEGGIAPENMNMEERFGIALTKAQPLRAIPVRF